MKSIATVAGLLAASATVPAAAQTVERAFTGASAGVEGGYLEHHFALEFETTDANGQLLERSDQYYRSHGIGGGAFAGYDLAFSPRGRIGVELGVQAGGRTNCADLAAFGPGASYAQIPRFGARAEVRAGYVLTPRLMGYALTGYGGNRYRIRDRGGIGDENSWGSSFIVGAGVEYRASPRLGARLQLVHVDNQTWSVFAGVPIRF